MKKTKKKKEEDEEEEEEGEEEEEEERSSRRTFLQTHHIDPAVIKAHILLHLSTLGSKAVYDQHRE